MPRFDISKNVQAHDKLLETLTNPLHRQIIENYRRHALLEVMGIWEDIFAPDMTVETPIYKFNYGEINGDIVGTDVHDFYRGMADAGANAIVVTDESLAVCDNGFGQKS